VVGALGFGWVILPERLTRACWRPAESFDVLGSRVFGRAVALARRHALHY